jgi:hypothetical protein
MELPSCRFIRRFPVSSFDSEEMNLLIDRYNKFQVHGFNEMELDELDRHIEYGLQILSPFNKEWGRTLVEMQEIMVQARQFWVEQRRLFEEQQAQKGVEDDQQQTPWR